MTAILFSFYSLKQLAVFLLPLPWAPWLEFQSIGGLSLVEHQAPMILYRVVTHSYIMIGKRLCENSVFPKYKLEPGLLTLHEDLEDSTATIWPLFPHKCMWSWIVCTILCHFLVPKLFASRWKGMLVSFFKWCFGTFCCNFGGKSQKYGYMWRTKCSFLRSTWNHTFLREEETRPW